MDNPDYQQRTPWWMTVIIIICMLPALSYPFMLSTMTRTPTTRTLMYLYPIYVIASGICAWRCYPQQKALAWIILVVLLMSHAAMWML